VSEPTADYALQVHGLCKSFDTPGEPLVVLNGIDLDVVTGTSMSVMGESGSGKSTFLHIVGTLERPTSGNVRVGGVDPFSLSAEKLARFRNTEIGFIFQDHHLLPQLTVLENVLIPTLVGDHNRADAEERVRSLIDKVGLTPRIGHRPAELSGGERQRTAVARALVNGPKLLLCDEPTGNLDLKTSQAIGHLFNELRSTTGVSFIVVTHSAHFAALFDRQFQIVSGALVENTPANAG